MPAPCALRVIVRTEGQGRGFAVRPPDDEPLEPSEELPLDDEDVDGDDDGGGELEVGGRSCAVLPEELPPGCV